MIVMIIEIEEAREFLRIDDDYADEIIIPLIQAIPSYIEVSTGYKCPIGQEAHPVAKNVAKFILLLWFDTQTEDSERLRRTIDSLFTALTLINEENHG